MKVYHDLQNSQVRLMLDEIFLLPCFGCGVGGFRLFFLYTYVSLNTVIRAIWLTCANRNGV